MKISVSVRKLMLTDEVSGETRTIIAASPLDDIVAIIWEREQQLVLEELADTVFSCMKST